MGVDFDETFSPVIKSTIVCTVLSLVVCFGWTMCQLDVKNAFFHGILDEIVYMAQPPSLIDPARLYRVCHLQKAIYGLKQAPRAWFQRLSTFLLQYSFTQSQADHSLFIYLSNSTTMFLLLYVDDIILIGNQPSLVSSFIITSSKEFELRCKTLI